MDWLIASKSLMADFKENVILGDQSIASLSTDFFFLRLVNAFDL